MGFFSFPDQMKFILLSFVKWNLLSTFYMTLIMITIAVKKD